MPEVVFAILLALCEGEMDRYEISAATGYADGYMGLVSQGMVERGWVGSHYCSSSDRVRKSGGGRKAGSKWWITERGKIAVAIEVGRRAKERACGVRRDRPLVSSFRYREAA